MSRQRHIAWEDVLDLRVVRRLGGIVCRRWNIGLGFGGADGTLYQGPAAVNYAIRRGPCELLRRLLGEQCRDNGRSAFRAIQEQVAAAALPGGAPPPRSLPLDCHAGLREVAAPILIEGEVEGFVYAGGYLHHESDGRQELSERLLRLGVPVESLPDVFSDLAVLSAADEQSHGAAVQIDDKPAGVLPTSQTLKPGIHFVKVTRVGFASWTSSVTVSPGSRVELPVLMRPVAAGGGGPTPRPIYKRWWFWTVIGAVVAAGATTGIYFAARPAAPPSMPQLDLR